MDTIRREELRLASADGRSTIRALVWSGAADGWAPRATVQVMHGMAEHVERYERLARVLVAHGLAVCGDDHIGHGASCEPARRGCLPARGGAEALVEDEHTLRLRVAELLGDVPHFLLGHSLGSYMARVYLATHGEGVAGAVLSGTGTLPVAISWAGHALALAVCAARGEDHRSRLLDGMGVGAYARAVPGPTGCEWLSHDEANVAAYVADERCGFPFSAGGYATVTKLTARACSLRWARRVPHDVPLLLVAGAEDPVGDCGRGVRAAAELARRAGQRSVEVRIYDGMRHEIFNEREGGSVMGDVCSWLCAQLGESRDTREGQ